MSFLVECDWAPGSRVTRRIRQDNETCLKITSTFFGGSKCGKLIFSGEKTSERVKKASSYFKKCGQIAGQPDVELYKSTLLKFQIFICNFYQLVLKSQRYFHILHLYH